MLLRYPQHPVHSGTNPFGAGEGQLSPTHLTEWRKGSKVPLGNSNIQLVENTQDTTQVCVPPGPQDRKRKGLFEAT